MGERVLERRRLQADLDAARQTAREGDPFDYIALQWGRIVTADEALADPVSPSPTPPLPHSQTLILDDFQRDIIGSLFAPGIRSTWVKGNTGCGKGGAAGIGICTYYDVWPDARVIISRDTADRAIKVVMGEVGRWWRKMRVPPANGLLQANGAIDARDRTHEIRVVNPESTEGFTGTHAPHVLVVFDEATAEVLTRFYPLVPTIAHKFLALANPRTTGGPFFDAFHASDEPDVTQTIDAPDGRRRLITVDGDEILNVRAGCEKHGDQGREPIIPGQTCWDEHKAICANLDADHVACFGHGRFPQDDKRLALFLRRWFDSPHRLWSRFDKVWQRAQSAERHRRHLARLRAWWPIRAVGLDVGSSTSGDPSILTFGGDRGIWRQLSARLDDATALADWVIEATRRECGNDLTEGGLPIGVDATDIGWGVCGILRQRGCHVLEIRGNDLTEHKRSYTNLRAQMYGEFSKRLDPDGQYGYSPGECSPVVFALPPDPALVQELRAVERVYGPDGMRFAATPKRRGPGLKEGTVTVEDRIKRSPDKGDSAAYFWRALQVGGISLEDALDLGFF